METPYQTVFFSLWRGFLWSTSTWVCYPSNTWSSVCLHNWTSGSGPHLIPKHPKHLHHYPQGPGTIYKNSHGKLNPVLLLRVLSGFCTGETSSLHLKIVSRDLHDICRATAWGLAEHVQLVCIIAVIPSTFSGVETECTGSTDLFSIY
jgi:hypothetical protein